jgi:hypothetical protein
VISVEFCPEASGKAKITTNIVITFNKNIRVKENSPAEITISGSGLFGGTHQKIDLRGTYDNKKYGNIYSASGNTLTINPTQPFKANTGYYMTIPNGVIIDDSCDRVWSGVNDTTTIAWTTDGASPTPPEGLKYSSVLFEMEYDRPILAGYAKMNIITPEGKLKTQLDARDIAVRIKYNERF